MPRTLAAEQPGTAHGRSSGEKYNRPMGILSGRKILVTGLLSNRSIAYGIARVARREGADIALTYQNERFKDRCEEMAKELGAQMALPCEVTDDAEIERLFAEVKSKWGQLDGLVHALAFAPREAIAGDFLDGVSREAFRQAHDISSYSFAALAKAAKPILSSKASLLTLTYLGAERGVPPPLALLRRRAGRADLQHQGARQGEPRGGRAVHGFQPGTERHPRERHLGRADQDAGGGRHRGVREETE